MQKILIGAVTIAFVLVFLFWIWPESGREIVNYPSTGTDTIAFGDSLVFGTGATAGNDWVSVLSRKTGESIINLGIPGDTTRDGLVRINEIDSYDPKIVMLLLGGNDYLKKVPQQETEQNLAMLISSFQERGAVVVLMGVRGGVLSDNYADMYERLAEQYGAVLVPNVLEGLIARPEYMSDAIHPNDAGYAIIAGRVYTEIKKVFD